MLQKLFCPQGLKITRTHSISKLEDSRWDCHLSPWRRRDNGLHQRSFFSANICYSAICKPSEIMKCNNAAMHKNERSRSVSQTQSDLFLKQHGSFPTGNTFNVLPIVCITDDAACKNTPIWSKKCPVKRSATLPSTAKLITFSPCPVPPGPIYQITILSPSCPRRLVECTLSLNSAPVVERAWNLLESLGTSWNMCQKALWISVGAGTYGVRNRLVKAANVSVLPK